MSDQYRLKPKKAISNDAEAWWYANRGHVEIHVQGKEQHYTVKIRRGDLARYVQWSEFKR